MSCLKTCLGIYGDGLEIGTDSTQTQIESLERGFYNFLVDRALFLLQARIVAQQTQRFDIGARSQGDTVAQVQVVFAFDDRGEISNGIFQRVNFGSGIGRLSAQTETDRQHYRGSRSPFECRRPLTSHLSPRRHRPIVQRIHAAPPRLHLAGADWARGKMSV
jgi:hypothetical protein